MTLRADSSVAELPLFQGEDGGAIPTSALQLFFKKIEYNTAIDFLIEHHYLHRKAPVSVAFGAYYNGSLIGACTIGKPASHTLINGVCGKERGSDVFELNRMCMLDCAPKNSESRFIGWIVRQLDKNTILVSYADTAQGHDGIIYKATNWIYTGTSIPFKDYTFDGMDHRSVPKHLRDKTKMKEVIRSKKHRFVYFCNPVDRSLLKWKQIQYKTKGE
jgi:hypothetical protein